MFDQVMAGTSRTAEEVVFLNTVYTYKQNDAATAILNPIRGL